MGISFLEAFPLNNSSNYRQLIPALSGECTIEESLLSTETPLEQTTLTNFIAEPNALDKDAWRAYRAVIEPDIVVAPDGTPTVDRIVMTGERDPVVEYRVNTNTALANQGFTGSVWLWTDADQPQEVAIAIYAWPSSTDIKRQKITLTTTPQLYSLSQTFPETQQDTNAIFRIQGIASGDQGTYLHAWNASLSSSQKLPVLSNVSDVTANNSKYYVYLESSDLSLGDLDVTLNYQDGASEFIRLARSAQIRNNGRYFVQLSDNFTGNLVSVAVTVPSTAQGIMQARLCELLQSQ